MKYLKILYLLIIFVNFEIVANIDSLKGEIEFKSGIAKINILSNIAEEYLITDVDSSIHYAHSALRLSNQINSMDIKISILNLLAFASYIQNKSDSAEYFANDALDLSRQLNDNIGKAKSLNVLGLIYWRRGDYPEAVDNYLKALDFATIAGNKEEIAKSNNYLGLVYWKTGNYPKSINYFFKSLELKKELNNKYEIALTLNNLSNIHNEIGDYIQAIKFAEEALNISKTLDNKYTLGRALGNLGVSYLKLNQKNKALEYLYKALNIKNESGEVKGHGYTLIDVGDIHYELNELTKAKNNYEDALEIMLNINDAHGLSIVYNKLAQISFHKNKYQTAFQYLDKSNHFANKENLRESKKDNFLLASKIYEKIGQPILALENFKSYSSLKDSLSNEKINSRIKELNINYETNQKEKENQLLKQSNMIQQLELERQKQYNYILLVAGLLAAVVLAVIFLRYVYIRKTNQLNEEKNKKIEKQRQKLNELNTTKDKFFSVLAHDLKNPFQTILGYTELLSTKYEELTEEEKRSSIEQMMIISKSSYHLLENLLSWANTQTGRIEYNPEVLILNKIANEAIEPVMLQAHGKNQQIQINIKTNLLVYTDKNIFSTILRNLVTNAVKFSPINGIIKIDAIEKDNIFIVKVEDNGRGILPSKLKELFKLTANRKSEGTANERGTGLGLVICKEFVEIYKGKIWVESEFERGSKFYFTVPKVND